MPKVFIELDYEVVAAAIKAKVPAAVEDILRRYDLQRLIEAAITSNEKPTTPALSSVEIHSDGRMGFMWTGDSPSPKSPRERFEETLNSVINSQLEEAIKSKITKYLEENLQMVRTAIEKKLPKALSKLQIDIRTNDFDDED